MFDSFHNLADLVRTHSATRPQQPALIHGDEQVSYAQLDALLDRIAAALQRDGVRPGEAIALCGQATPTYAALFLGGLRAGAAVAPLSPTVTPADFAAMLRDCGARWLFADAATAALVPAESTARCIALEPGAHDRAFHGWLAPPGTTPRPVAIEPDAPFNIIYSSGTTGTPARSPPRNSAA